MQLAPVLIGAISAQSGDDADRWDNTDFSLTDNIFTYEAPKDQRFDGAACTNELVIQAVTCWESNHMGNLDHYVTRNDDGFGWKNIHHGHDQGGHSATSSSAATNGLRQGTQESTNYGKRVPSTSPNYQIGTYSRGMVTDGVNGASNKIDYHSAMAFDNRYSGCIYEAAGWDYSASTYNEIWRMSYGYDPTRIEEFLPDGVTALPATGPSGDYLNDASGVDRSNTVPIRPNWWHYFNSHILNVGQFDNEFDSYERHLLVMANPAYEGLGYLNWITTFAKYNSLSHGASGAEVADRGKWGGTVGQNGFVGSDVVNAGAGSGYNAAAPSGSLYDEGRFRGMINHNTHDTVTDLYSGGYAFHLAMGCTTTKNAAASPQIAAEMPTYAAAEAALGYQFGTAVNYDHQMNAEINTPTRAKELVANMHTSGYNYDTYSTTGQNGAAQAELRQWYSFLINKGAGTVSDPSLQTKTDGNIAFYPWMSMAAVSSFPHNDLGQDFRFNIRILHHGGRGFPYNFMGNEATSVLATDATHYDVVDGGTPAAGEDFSITNAQIQYLAQDSYYWYKVNTVQIMFPSYVRCPRFPRNITTDKPGTNIASISGTNPMAATLEREEELTDTFRCMDSANFNGHRGWDSSLTYQHDIEDVYAASAWNGIDSTATTGNHRPDVNHPIYLEQLTENDGSKYYGIVVDHNKNADDTATDSVLDSANGFICGDVPPFGSLTAGDYKGGWYKCGQKYAVHGLMNAYDEHAQLEYGTTQEIWFQFWYHYVITWDTDAGAAAPGTPLDDAEFWDKRNSNTIRHEGKTGATNPDETWPAGTQDVFHDNAHDDAYFTLDNYRNAYASGTDTIRYDHVHNFPNILFNAFEIKGIRFYCDKSNSLNSNECFHTGNTQGSAYTPATLIGDSMTNP
jgi:hypothetical protein